MNDRQQRFIRLLEQIFEVDKSDLDFGIYRIMNIRRDEIGRFFTESLPRQIEAILAPFAEGGKADIRRRIDEIEAQLGDAATIATLSDALPVVAEYRQLQQKLAAGVDLAALEADVYSALYSFFSRYYEEGDFISKRRYKEGVYAIPYEGEEVKLYWANQDQYYIKTAENFKDYTFTADGYTVHFRLVDATTEQGNNKESEQAKRVFMLFEEDEAAYPGLKTFGYDEATRTLTIRFLYDIPADKKRRYDEDNFKRISAYLAAERTQLAAVLMRNVATKADDFLPLLLKHLKAYVAKNTFDYFIHKDLGGFLRRELDFYIKNEVLHLDDLDTSSTEPAGTTFAKIRAIRRVAGTIIDFLAQMENFQRRLWLKKKFVVETNYCLTLDRIPEDFYPEIIANEAQLKEWIDDFAIDEIKGDLATTAFSRPLTVEFLRENQNLVLDTCHFSSDFRDRLIAAIDDLDGNTNGLLINSDNYHAIKMLGNRYKGSIKCIYLDPPYNTGPSEILYKNNYKDSSWLSLMHSRLSLMMPLMSEDCTISVAIDDYEMVRLAEMMTELFVDYDRNMIVVNHHPQGTPKDNVSRTHEYAIVMTPSGQSVMAKEGNVEGKETRALMRSGSAENNFRYGRPNSFYAFLVDPTTKRIMGTEAPPALGTPYPKGVTSEGWLRIYPLSKDGTERVWRVSYNSAKCNMKDASVNELNALICCSKTNTLYQIITSKKEPINSNWIDKRYNAGTYGTALIGNLFGDSSVFSYPKSLYTVEDYVSAVTDNGEDNYVLDFFGGSGTTGHAVIDLNRKDDGLRKYILVEMGEYFNTATKPRIKKVIYSPDWRDGKPVGRTKGVSQIVKYLRLESYEDALSNVELRRRGDAADLFGDEYVVKYMLDIESRDSLMSVEKFTAPFSYEMRITERNEARVRRVDVVETFNYLVGLAVTRRSVVQRFAAAPAAAPAYEGAVDLQRSAAGTFLFQQVEGRLPDGRRALVIWRSVGDRIAESNAALDAYFTRYRINPRDREYDVIYVNGDNNLENLRTDNEAWKVVVTEEEFNRRMWEEA